MSVPAPNAQQVQNWAEAGHHWVAEAERYDRMLRPWGDAVLDAAAPAAGERVLDVGCGTGATTLAAAARVAPGGHAVGVDLSPPMLSLARDRAGRQGIENVSFVEDDAQIADFQPGEFDAAVSRFGVMFFADPAAAFANIRGAMRTGGRLAFACWQDLAHNEIGRAHV
jgi:ubiquinone/menaquinone biosynthesis C-methylase UbiE